MVAKPLNTTKYHLATFDHKLHSNTKLPKHILKEATREAIDAEVKEAEKRENIADGSSLQEEKPALARKIQRMRYFFEEEVEEEEPAKGVEKR